MNLASINRTEEPKWFCIDTPVALSTGMGDMVKLVRSLSNYALHNGLLPVVKMTGQNQYLNYPDDNMWEYYFEQPYRLMQYDDGNIPVYSDDLKVISSSEEHLGYWELFNTDELKAFMIEENGLIRFNQQMTLLIDSDPVISSLRKMIGEGKRVLAVILRGSDKTPGRINDAYIKNLLNNFEQIDSYDSFVVASEDEALFDAFMKRYSDKTLYFPQKRSTYDYSNNEFVVLGATGELESGREWGGKYLMITYALSLCDDLAYNVGAGTRWLARLWKIIHGKDYSNSYRLESISE